MKKNDGGPAFPGSMHDPSCVNFCCYRESGGLTVRRWYASMALQGLCANSSIDLPYDKTAIMALKQADAMIEAENQEEKEYLNLIL